MNYFNTTKFRLPQPYLIILSFILILLFIKVNNIYNKEQFQTFTDNDVVIFYTDWCKYSNLFLDVWDNTINNFSHYKFYKIDCDTNKDLVSRYSITKLPNVYIFKNSMRIKYEGEIDRTQFLNFLKTGKNSINNCDSNNENCN